MSRAWTLHDPHNAAFSLPNGTKRDASAVMLQAFQESIGELSKTLGTIPRSGNGANCTRAKFTSRLGPEPLSYGPRASGGDEWTLNHAPGGLDELT